MWDASFSMADINREREIGLVKSLVAGAGEIGLTVYRNVSGMFKHYTVKQQIQNMFYDLKV